MSPEQFHQFTNPMPDAMCLLSADGRILAVNDATSRFVKSDSGTLHGMTLFDLVADSSDKVKQNLRNWARSREMTPGPLQVRIGHEKILPCNCSGCLVDLKSSHTPATILVRLQTREHFSKSFSVLNKKIAQLQKEIIVRRKIETALAKSKAEFEAMFNAISDAVLFVDTDRRIVMINPSVYTMFGYSDEDLVGHTTEILYADKEDFLDQGRRRYRTDQQSAPGAYEVRYKRNNGSVFWSETIGTQVKDSAGHTIGFIALIRDISERKKTEQELMDHRLHLEELVKERTHALENSNKELESYSYSIAHDLRSPLRAIGGYCQIIKEDASERLNSEDKKNLQRVIDSTAHMATLIDDILELSRVARTTLHMDELDLSAICHDISAALSMSDARRKVEWRIQPRLKAYGDYQLMYIVLSNLMSNAWKFTQNKSPTVIEFGSTEDTHGENVFFIRDNGAGFDMQYANKLFGLFQRLHNSQEYEGTGIGLATVQRIISRHFGWVKVEGELDKGACVYFYLPQKS